MEKVDPVHGNGPWIGMKRTGIRSDQFCSSSPGQLQRTYCSSSGISSESMHDRCYYLMKRILFPRNLNKSWLFWLHSSVGCHVGPLRAPSMEANTLSGPSTNTVIHRLENVETTIHTMQTIITCGLHRNLLFLSCLIFISSLSLLFSMDHIFSSKHM